VRGRAFAWTWGIVLSCFLFRFFFDYPPGVFHANHEGSSYVSRVVEFRALLEAGYPFPQWAVHFRGGLGSPYFGYYQPAFFYVASVFATVMPVVHALGATLMAFALVGYGGMLGLVGPRFGAAGGVLAGTMLLLSSYAIRNVYLRGDFSEYCGMMLLPALLCWLLSWLEFGRRGAWLALAPGCAVLVPLHPAAALFGYGSLGAALLWYAATTRAWRRVAWAGGALVAGIGVAAFFWLSVWLEWDLVQGDRAVAPPYLYSGHFIEPPQLFISSRNPLLMDFELGTVLPWLVAASSLLLLVTARTVTRSQWRLVGLLWLLVAAAVFLMSSVSEPVWAALPLLQRVQFPWRLLMLLSVAGAALAGTAPRFGCILLAAAIASLGFTWSSGKPALTSRFLLPATPAEIATRFVRPDVMNEWLPIGATAIDPFKVTHFAEPKCQRGCRVTEFTRAPGRLTFGVEGNGIAARTVTLPHYDFPVGWTAHVSGQTAPRSFLPPTRFGLMRMAIRPGEHVEVVFRTTPGRRKGAMVSAFSLALLLLVAWRWPRSAPASPPPAGPRPAPEQ